MNVGGKMRERHASVRKKEKERESDREGQKVF